MIYLFGKNLPFYGSSKSRKIDIEPWTKEDIIGSWETVFDSRVFTFNEDTLVIQVMNNRVPTNETFKYEITLTDEYYERKEITRVYYYFYDNKLILSSGLVFEKYEEALP